MPEEVLCQLGCACEERVASFSSLSLSLLLSPAPVAHCMVSRLTHTSPRFAVTARMLTSGAFGRVRWRCACK